MVQPESEDLVNVVSELLIRIHQEKLDKPHLKKLVEKAVHHLPGRERNRIRKKLAKQLGFKSWKELSDRWPC